MRVHSRLTGIGFSLAMVASVWALSAISPGAAGASPAATPRDRAQPAPGGPGIGFSQVPQGLRTAVQESLGGPLSNARPTQQAELKGSDSAASDNFGRAVAVSGSTAVVGAWLHNSATGAAYVFVRSGTTWTQQAELNPSDATANEFFGWSVAVSGSTAVIGAPGRTSGTGAAYVFARSGTTWSQQAELTASDGAQGDELGSSVAVSKSTAAVGAPYHNASTGTAYVFARSGTTWSQQAELTATDGVSGDELGLSVAVSGSTTVAGALYRNSESGAAYVFVRSGTTWSQQAELAASDGAPGDTFGRAVAVSGSTTVIGAPLHNSGTGAAYVFARSGTTWSQRAELPGAASGDGFGTSVAVSGTTAVIGAPFHKSGTGAAYVYAHSGGTWTRHAKLKASDGVQGDDFGWSVSVSVSTAAIGAPYHNSDTGVAYVFAGA